MVSFLGGVAVWCRDWTGVLVAVLGGGVRVGVEVLGVGVVGCLRERCGAIVWFGGITLAVGVDELLEESVWDEADRTLRWRLGDEGWSVEGEIEGRGYWWWSFGSLEGLFWARFEMGGRYWWRWPAGGRKSMFEEVGSFDACVGREGRRCWDLN